MLCVLVANVQTILEQFLPDLAVLEEKSMAHSLEGFSFARDAFSFNESNLFRHDPTQDSDEDENQPLQDNDNDVHMDGADDGVLPPVEDFFTGDQAAGEDYMPDDAFSPVNEDGSVGPHDPTDQSHAGTGGLVPFDPNRAPNERDLVMAMTGDGDETGGGMMMDYFDQTFLKNWAGPEHWKLRKVVRKRK